MAAIPAEEKLAIATHFLLSSPPGEIKEVLADVKVCLDPPTLLSDSVLKGIFRKYNIANFQVVETENGGTVLLSEDAEVDAAHYIDSSNQTVVEIDHVAQAIAKGTEASAAPGNGLESTIASIHAAVGEYVNSQYVGGATQLTGFAVLPHKSGQEGDIVVQISAQKTNLRNYWSGKWRSEFVVKTKSKKIAGSVRILAHYFEDGNVQMDTRKDIPAEAYAGDNIGLAVKTFINKQEGMIQNTLEEMYINMSQETFKDMRRVLPITKTKMDWSGASLKLASAFGVKDSKKP